MNFNKKYNEEIDLLNKGIQMIRNSIPDKAILVELKRRILADKKKLIDHAYGSNNMLIKGYGRCIMLIDEMIKEIKEIKNEQAD